MLLRSAGLLPQLMSKRNLSFTWPDLPRFPEMSDNWSFFFFKNLLLTLLPVFLLFILFFIFGCAGLCGCVWAFSSCGKWALISCRRARLYAHGFSSCSSQAQLPCGTCDLPGPAIEPMSPALAGGFLTTGPPRKSWIIAG